MKHLMTLMALVVAMTAGAQGTTIHEYPWNPDWNNDNYIGSQDLTGFLSAFGSEFGNPPEPCTYDGTPLEDWWSNALAGEIIVDSIFFELFLIDSSLVYYPGCPDPVMDTVNFAFTRMITPSIGTSHFGHSSINCSGGGLHWQFEFDATSGIYRIRTLFPLLNQLGFYSDGFFGCCHNFWQSSEGHSLPFPSDWILDEDGIHINSGWGSSSWPSFAEYLHILPYWHYAE